ncbi:hypothetical protein HBB16_17020 [Pseudonocardia sp. MCCB 268]|nr:hypothetical protein [Pseudonocardia cytotoxica]
MGCGSSDFAAGAARRGRRPESPASTRTSGGPVRPRLTQPVDRRPGRVRHDQVERSTTALVCQHPRAHPRAGGTSGGRVARGAGRGGGHIALLAEGARPGPDHSAEARSGTCSTSTAPTSPGDPAGPGQQQLRRGGRRTIAVRLTYADQYVVAEAGPRSAPGTPELAPHLRDTPARGLPRLRRPGRPADRALAWLAGRAGRGRRRRRRRGGGQGEGLTFLQRRRGRQPGVRRGRRRARRSAGRRRHQPGLPGPPRRAGSGLADPAPEGSRGRAAAVGAADESGLRRPGPRHPGRPGPDRDRAARRSD